MNASTIEQTFAKMRAAYGPFISSQSLLELDVAKVPADLIGYIPYAALWGVADDLEREQRIAQAPESAKTDLVTTVRSIDDLLDEWLAGDEARSPRPSREYIAFSAMRMAADFM